MVLQWGKFQTYDDASIVMYHVCVDEYKFCCILHLVFKSVFSGGKKGGAAATPTSPMMSVWQPVSQYCCRLQESPAVPVLLVTSPAESQMDKLLWKFTVSFARLCGTGEGSITKGNFKNKPENWQINCQIQFYNIFFFHCLRYMSINTRWHCQEMPENAARHSDWIIVYY